jgi:hypothetical protein
MSAYGAREWTSVAMLVGIALCSVTPAATVAAGIGGGGGGFGGGAAGFSGGAAGIGGGTAGFGIAPRVASPIPGVPLPPVGYDGSKVGPSTSARPAPRLDPQLSAGPEQPRLYNAATPGPRFDQSGTASSAASGGSGGHGGILPPDGSGYLVVEDGAGGATIYGPTGVRRVKTFDRTRIHELTRP